MEISLGNHFEMTAADTDSNAIGLYARLHSQRSTMSHTKDSVEIVLTEVCVAGQTPARLLQTPPPCIRSYGFSHAPAPVDLVSKTGIST